MPDRYQRSSRSYLVPPQAARTIAALLTLRDHVIAPIIAGVRSPRIGRKPAIWQSGISMRPAVGRYPPRRAGAPEPLR